MKIYHVVAEFDGGEDILDTYSRKIYAESHIKFAEQTDNIGLSERFGGDDCYTSYRIDEHKVTR